MLLAAADGHCADYGGSHREALFPLPEKAQFQEMVGPAMLSIPANRISFRFQVRAMG